VFTGIIATIGTVSSIKEIEGGRELVVSVDNDFFIETKHGDSVAVNGVCLTVTSFDSKSMTVFAQIETLSKTTIGQWREGDLVNLEHPLRLSDRLGGHLVQGHVDGVGVISEKTAMPDGSVLVSFEIPADLHKFIVDKGSISLDGVSLTVAEKTSQGARVALIPATLEKTTYSKLDVGDHVNVEIDAIARYVEQLINR